LQQTVRKRLALEQHLETLHSTLLNQQVMNSVKQTSGRIIMRIGCECLPSVFPGVASTR
jgi:hypothetical protein